jgi:hypothetical protein
MSYDREDFRAWLASHEGDDKPFTEADCPIATYARRHLRETIRISEAPFKALWCRDFVRAVDRFCDVRAVTWGGLTAKDCLTVLDDLDVTA